VIAVEWTHAVVFGLIAGAVAGVVCALILARTTK
jgi:ABC-type uncharacterized transport system permease subunit